MSAVQNTDLSSQIGIVVKELENILNNTGIIAANILAICLSAMQLIERISNNGEKISGQNKKSIVLGALSFLLEKNNGDLALLTTIPDFIDAVISIEKGVVQIGGSVKEIACCCVSFCSPKK